MSRQEIVVIASSAQLRNRQATETLTLQRDFWMKAAEQLHDQLENIFDQAQEHGKVDIYRNGVTIKLVTPTVGKPEPSS